MGKFRDKTVIDDTKKRVFEFLHQYFHPDNVSWINGIASFDAHSGCLEMRIHTSGVEYCNSDAKYGYKMSCSVKLKIPVRNKFKEIEYSIAASHKTDYVKCLNNLFKGMQEDFAKLQSLTNIFNKQPIHQFFQIDSCKNKFYDTHVFVGKKEHADLLLDYVRKNDGDCGLRDDEYYPEIRKHTQIVLADYLTSKKIVF